MSLTLFALSSGEADRPWFTTEESHDVDHVLTTAELASIFQERGIDLPVRTGGKACICSELSYFLH